MFASMSMFTAPLRTALSRSSKVWISIFAIGVSLNSHAVP